MSEHSPRPGFSRLEKIIQESQESRSELVPESQLGRQWKGFIDRTGEGESRFGHLLVLVEKTERPFMENVWALYDSLIQQQARKISTINNPEGQQIARLGIAALEAEKDGTPVSNVVDSEANSWGIDTTELAELVQGSYEDEVTETFRPLRESIEQKLSEAERTGNLLALEEASRELWLLDTQLGDEFGAIGHLHYNIKVHESLHELGDNCVLDDRPWLDYKYRQLARSYWQLGEYQAASAAIDASLSLDTDCSVDPKEQFTFAAGAYKQLSGKKVFSRKKRRSLRRKSRMCKSEAVVCGASKWESYDDGFHATEIEWRSKREQEVRQAEHEEFMNQAQKMLLRWRERKT